jgi:hypothetical protein
MYGCMCICCLFNDVSKAVWRQEQINGNYMNCTKLEGRDADSCFPKLTSGNCKVGLHIYCRWFLSDCLSIIGLCLFEL